MNSILKYLTCQAVNLAGYYCLSTCMTFTCQANVVGYSRDNILKSFVKFENERGVLVEIVGFISGCSICKVVL
jgi:hypothetical protein